MLVVDSAAPIVDWRNGFKDGTRTKSSSSGYNLKTRSVALQSDLPRKGTQNPPCFRVLHRYLHSTVLSFIPFLMVISRGFPKPYPCESVNRTTLRSQDMSQTLGHMDLSNPLSRTLWTFWPAQGFEVMQGGDILSQSIRYDPPWNPDRDTYIVFLVKSDPHACQAS